MTKKPKYAVGDTFSLSSDALYNYGEQYAGKTFTVRAVYDHYTPVARMASDPSGHPGFDESGGSALYGIRMGDAPMQRLLSAILARILVWLIRL